jgi:methylisocitrate lyase
VARTDAVEAEGLESAIRRARLYVEAGAHVVFPDALRSADELRAFAAAVPAPLLANMTEFGRTPLLPADELAALGYRMVIWPVTALRVAARAMEELYRDLAARGTQAAWLDRMQTRRELYEVIDYQSHEALDTSIAKSVLPDEIDRPRVE